MFEGTVGSAGAVAATRQVAVICPCKVCVAKATTGDPYVEAQV